MEQKHTPGPWKWVFLGNAGNYFLLGNNGEGPITHSGPDTPDGRLKEAAPILLAAAEYALSTLCLAYDAEDGEAAHQLRAAIAASKGE